MWRRGQSLGLQDGLHSDHRVALTLFPDLSPSAAVREGETGLLTERSKGGAVQGSTRGSSDFVRTRVRHQRSKRPQCGVIMISDYTNDVLVAHSATQEGFAPSAPTRTLSRSGSTTKRLASPPHRSPDYETLKGPPGSKSIEGCSGGQLVSLTEEKSNTTTQTLPPLHRFPPKLAGFSAMGTSSR